MRVPQRDLGDGMISIVRVRFDTNNDPTSVWSDELFDHWMQPLIPYSMGDYWWSSSKALFSVEYTLYGTLVIPDPRSVAPPSVSPRNALVQGCIDGLPSSWRRTGITPTFSCCGSLSPQICSAGARRTCP